MSQMGLEITKSLYLVIIFYFHREHSYLIKDGFVYHLLKMHNRVSQFLHDKGFYVIFY